MPWACPGRAQLPGRLNQVKKHALTRTRETEGGAGAATPTPDRRPDCLIPQIPDPAPGRHPGARGVLKCKPGPMQTPRMGPRPARALDHEPK